ncbi:E2F-associated phosphoprotein, putative [Plasmodium berghei]|uniref:E2F-associated phosphoprotein, putative n=2 Tax=Plasmodium berghei TaxID=5821 RepID=A0A509AKA3_PLABA|nr:E2F-associated phosphoprotein, putative [Plasmodium berghei ANKA]SCL91178.1 E2F-associated phosphoprotein, putative [Plasmodium berghei]SCM15441.1 E2F-associated phosphoprotein, putative [Plasmodium berghei]SCN22338.1 E2F-associated phosphoprotein, putative [Plasmodium berghei]VUC54182.1 E2F-associated phosphoprotein, putative [Plasmodium berghei ANKA]|eukprot:XP_034420027.1 E2F-associated phosphoprotein, putative [Plasmodium berghei ANKA]
MNKNKANNNVINLLINEIKLNERSENASNLPNEKGINIAKSFLNINNSENNDLYTNSKSKIKNTEQNEDQINSATNEEDFGDDVIGDNEKAALEFYDDKIDNYDEEYVNKKYRFCTKSEDSSLCCCGCFTPVCYQSQRHEYYVNQYRSLFAVNVKINKETILYENEINITKNGNEIQQNECQDIKKQNKEKSETYNPVFCVNCNNHIAYFEIENSIFHFFDVLPD